MKRCTMVLILIGLLVMTSQAYAFLDDNSTTNNTTVNVTKVENVENKTLLDLPYGVGADVKLIDLTKVVEYKGILDSINAEYKYDMNNQSHSIFGVVKIDLTFWQK